MPGYIPQTTLPASVSALVCSACKREVVTVTVRCGGHSFLTYDCPECGLVTPMRSAVVNPPRSVAHG